MKLLNIEEAKLLKKIRDVFRKSFDHYIGEGPKVITFNTVCDLMDVRIEEPKLPSWKKR